LFLLLFALMANWSPGHVDLALTGATLFLNPDTAPTAILHATRVRLPMSPTHFAPERSSIKRQREVALVIYKASKEVERGSTEMLILALVEDSAYGFR
jgi:hypothetical protein